MKPAAVLQKKIGPLSLWVWAVALLALGAVYVIWKRRGNNSGAASGGTATVLTTGVLPQGTPSGGYPSNATPPAQGLSPAVQDALSAQFSDVYGTLSDLGARQDQIQTDLGAQTQALADRQQDLGAAVTGGLGDVAARLGAVDTTIAGLQAAAVAHTTLSPPAASGFNQVWIPSFLRTSPEAPKPTTNVANTKPKKAVTQTKAKAQKPAPKKTPPKRKTVAR